MYYGERLNSISHLVGAVFALIGLGALLTLAWASGDVMVWLGYGVFGFSMVLLYTMSTLYHSFKPPQLKKLFKLFDHIAIYLLIAGSYTPFMLISMPGNSGLPILGLVWGLAAIGIVSELTLKGRAIKLGQVIIYLLMGWACSLDMSSLRAELSSEGFMWLLAGGIAYSAGVIFYALDKMKRLNHAHGIWHFFVLLGSTAHYVCVVGYVR